MVVNTFKDKISFFAETEFMRLIAKELINRGYNVVFDKIDSDTKIAIAMGMISSMRLKYTGFNGIIVNNVFDIPEWRLEEKQYKGMYNEYKEYLKKSNVVTLSNWTSSELKRIWGIESIPLFTEFDNWNPDKIPDIIESQKKNQIFMVGRFVGYKRYEEGIEAVKKSGVNAEVVLTGLGNEFIYKMVAEELKQPIRIIKNNDGSAVDREIIFKEMKQSKLVLHPSDFEGKSMVPKEAIWCNTNVIISDIPVHREFHKNVVFHKVGDIDGLAKLIKENYNKPFNKKSKEDLLPFTIEKTTDKIEKYLSDLK
jgi:glycosyltransferase involved in cell wall biosynthesis